MQKYDYSKLLGRMKECGFTQVELAKRIGISETSINLTLRNKRDFRQDEITNVASTLDIAPEDIPTYFFAHRL